MSSEIANAEAYWKLYGEKVFAAISEADCSDDITEIRKIIHEIEVELKKVQIEAAQISINTKMIDNIDRKVENIRDSRIKCSERHFNEEKKVAIDTVSLAKDVKHQATSVSLMVSFGITVFGGIIMFLINHFSK
jgi:hypothetical protein